MKHLISTIAACSTILLGACSSEPVTKAGPFSEKETVFVRSEDGEFKIVKAKIVDSEFRESYRGEEIFTGIVKLEGENSFAISNERETLECKTSNDFKAICGAVRYEKAKGDFQFDRKVPFHLTETISMSILGTFKTGQAKRTATVMFDSQSDSIYVGSKKAGSYKFRSPSKFKINLDSYLINWGSGGYSQTHVVRSPICSISELKLDTIICTDAYTKDNGLQVNYTLMMEFVDKDDKSKVTGKSLDETS